jgi:macrolide-specific efflux system membrane fusion protein
VSLLVAALLGAGLLARQLFGPGTPPAFITARPERMDLEQTVLASGTLSGSKTVDVGAQVSGQLKLLRVGLGDQVRKGQLLAEIDPVLQQYALSTAEAGVQSLQAQRDAQQALLRQYELAFRRQQQMVAREAGASADLESAQGALENTRATIASLDAQIVSGRIAVATARANLDYTRIVAPMDGTVISITTQQGQTVVSNQSAPTILTLANLDTLTVKAQISEADVDKVRPGQVVYFTTLGDAQTRHYSRLRAIEPAPTSYTTASSTSSSSSSSSSSSTSTSSAVYYNGLFDLPNPGHRLRTSMTAQVSVVLQSARQALCVPASALGDPDPDGSCLVRVLVAGQPRPRRVRIGINNHIQAQVLEGLGEGDQVLIGDGSVPAPVQHAGPMGGPPPQRRG